MNGESQISGSGADGRRASKTVERALLIRRLESSRGPGISVIEAGPGWGKTQLLQQWARQLQRRRIAVHWLERDASEWNIPDWNAAETPPEQRSPCLIVIDDFHLIEDQRQRQLLATLLRNPPPGAHIAIAARGRVDLALGNHWLQGHLIRVSEADLALCADEAQQFFGASLTAQELVRVMAWSEGWPAMLSYLRDRLAPGAGLESVLEAAIGRDGEVTRFIAEQVLQPLPASERELLTRTAFLPTFHADLARVVSGTANTWETLRSLESRLLITAHRVDAKKRVDYRCHPLTRQVLLQDLAQRGRRELRRLHRTAARSLHREGNVAGAVRCACDGEDYSFAARVSLAAGGVLYAVRHGVAALRSLLELLPGDVIRQHPRLILAHVYVLVNEGAFPIAHELIDTVRRGLLAEQDKSKRTSILQRDLAIVEIALATYTNLSNADEQIAVLERGIEAADPGDLLSLGTLNNLLAWLHFRHARFDSAAVRAQSALHYYSRGAAPNGSAYTHLLLGLVDIEHACLDSAIEHYQCARALFKEQSLADDAKGRELADVLLAEALYEQGHLSEARALCDPAVDRIAAASYNLLAVACRTLASLTACEQGPQAAEAVFVRGLTLARKQGFAKLERVLDLYRREIALLSGPPTAEDAVMEDASSGDDWREHDTRLFLQARSALRSHQQEVIGLLERMSADFARQSRTRSQIDALVLLAVAQLHVGDRADSLQTLATAIRLGTPQSLLRPFIEHARTLAPLLLQTRERSKDERELAFINRVLAIGTTSAAVGAITFSQRELEVLRLLGGERENKSIARELRISPETVRFHLKNVYEKLGVKDRSLVAQIARERGLLTNTR